MNHEFEAPIAHEAHPFSAGEFTGEFEWETHESSHHATQEWETHEQPEADPFLGNILGAVGSALGLGEEEWETHENPFAQEQTFAQGEEEWETLENPYTQEQTFAQGEEEWETLENPFSQETALEADPFIGKAFRKLTRGLPGLVKRFAPGVVRSLAGMIPGVGAVAGPLLGRLTQQIVREASATAESLEAQLFNQEGGSFEVGPSEAALEAALTETLAAEAVNAEMPEAESLLATSLPITITIMGGRNALRPVMPALAQANRRVVRALATQGPAGRQALRLMPTINRQTVAILRAARRRGAPLTSNTAARAVATAAASVLGNPRRVQQALGRNLILRQRSAPSRGSTPIFAPRAASGSLGARQRRTGY